MGGLRQEKPVRGVAMRPDLPWLESPHRRVQLKPREKHFVLRPVMEKRGRSSVPARRLRSTPRYADGFGIGGRSRFQPFKHGPGEDGKFLRPDGTAPARASPASVLVQKISLSRVKSTQDDLYGVVYLIAFQALVLKYRREKA